MKRGTCQFCGRKDVEIDAEHLCPTWMGNTALLGLEAPQLRIARGDKVVHQTSTARGISAINITARCACKLKCNNGWMNVLETQVSHFMKPMVDTGRTTHLSAERQLLIARWQSRLRWSVSLPIGRKTSTFCPTRESISASGYSHLMMSGWLAHSLLRPQVHTFPIYLHHKNSPLRRPAVYAFSFSAGHFLVQVFAYRRRDWQERNRLNLGDGPFEGGLIPIWPPRKEAVSWPPPIAISDSSLNDFENRFFREAQIGGVRLSPSPRKR